MLALAFASAVGYPAFASGVDTTARKECPTVGVVLSGGGAKGFAHLGALKVIEQAGVRIDYIGGTSIGAIVGEHNSGNISYCYWNGDLEGIPAGGGGSQTGNAKFGDAWPQPSTHEAWRTTADTPAAYWRTLGSAGGGYPKLAWEK